jgi:methionyl-tRNA formyltransferase
MIYNLIRAVAPPYPGAFTELNGSQVTVIKSFLPIDPQKGLAPNLCDFLKKAGLGAHLVDNRCFGVCGDGKVLELFLDRSR